MGAVDKAAVVLAIQRLAEQNGGVPIGKERFIAETGFKQSLWEGRFWVTWGDAVREAGYEPNAMQGRRQTDDDLLRHLAELARTLGRFPTIPHMRVERRTNSDFPNERVITRRLGGRSDQIGLLHEFIERTPGVHCTVRQLSHGTRAYSPQMRVFPLVDLGHSTKPSGVDVVLRLTHRYDRPRLGWIDGVALLRSRKGDLPEHVYGRVDRVAAVPRTIGPDRAITVKRAQKICLAPRAGWAGER
jgi:hypothetical protein